MKLDMGQKSITLEIMGGVEITILEDQSRPGVHIWTTPFDEDFEVDGNHIFIPVKPK